MFRSIQIPVHIFQETTIFRVLNYVLTATAGRNGRGEKLRHVQELPHRRQQRNDRFRHDEYRRFLHLLLPHHR